MCRLAKMGRRKIRGQSQEGQQGSNTRAARIAITARHMVIMAGLCWLRRDRGAAHAGGQRCKDKRSCRLLDARLRRQSWHACDVVDAGRRQLSRCFCALLKRGAVGASQERREPRRY